MVAHTRRPLMNQHASKKSVPPSVGADVSGIETLLNRNLPEAPQFRNFTPKIVCCACRPALSSVTTHWTSSPAISERSIPTMFIPLVARPRFCTIRDGWRGARGRKAKRPSTPVWISSSQGTARSRLFMSTSTRRPHEQPERIFASDFGIRRSGGGTLTGIRGSTSLSLEGRSWKGARPLAIAC
jgi:hypothetical protein